MDENFDYSKLVADAEARLDDQGVPAHFGAELVLAEGETFRGRFRGQDVDRAFDPPRVVYLLVDEDGTPRFMRSRTKLDQQMLSSEAAKGDLIAIVRGQDTETKQGNTLHMYGVGIEPCSDPLPGEDEAATDDDIPF